MKNHTHNKKEVLLLLDMHGLIHRAYHALPDFRSRAGEPTGALYGLSTMLLKAIKTFQPDYVVAAFDMPGPTFRHVAYEDYKATRKKAEDDLVHQLKRAHDVVKAFGIEEYSKAGFEADDVVGTVVEQTKKIKNLKVIIVSGDADVFQLIDDDRVVVYTMRKGIEDTILYDESGVTERFGFGPQLLPDYKGLRGDTSDNIKGVPGVGEKTATEVIKHFGSLEELYKAIEKKTFVSPAFLKARMLDLLRIHKEDALFSKELATIRRDTPISFSLPKKQFVISESAIISLFQELGFQSLIRRFDEIKKSIPVNQGLFDTASSTSGNAPSDTSPAKVYRDGDTEKEELWREIAEASTVYISYGAEQVFILAKNRWQCVPGFLKRATQQQVMRLNTKEVVTDNGKALVKEHIENEYDVPANIFDCIVAGWVCDSSLTLATLGSVSERFLRIDGPASDPLILLPLLYEALQKELDKGSLREMYETIERPLQRVLATMERHGILVDQDFFAELKKEFSGDQKKLEQGIYADAGAEFNINSPLQVGDVLFQKLSLGNSKIKKTTTGRISTRESELVKLRDMHPIVAKILDYREISKILSTYVEPLSTLAAASHGVIHATFNQTGTVTGRLSSDSPNLQNIPIRSALGARVRNGFVARQGHLLVAFDYAQIELKILASVAQDKQMIKAFCDGIDIHRATAAAINKVALEDVTPVMRSRAKAINFGIIYGMGVRQLAQNTGMTQTEASTFYNEYFDSFPRIREYINKMKALVYKQGYVETLFGRRRYFNLKEIKGNRFLEAEMERMAVNAAIQGTDADIMKQAMILVDQKCDNALVQPLIQIHDEMIYEIPRAHVDEYAKKIVAIMSGVARLEVPLTVHVKVGPRWGEFKELKKTS